MKSKRLKKNYDFLNSHDSKIKEEASNHLIKFNMNRDSIACFIGDKKNNKQINYIRELSKKSSKPSIQKSTKGCSQPKNKEFLEKKEKVEESDFISQSLNGILKEIENRGVAHQWKQPIEIRKAHQQCQKEVENQPENSRIWTLLSVSDCEMKSHASTMDFYHPNQYFQISTGSENAIYTYQTGSQYGNFNEGNYFLVKQEWIENDPRTTLMIRNIPNKYTIKDLSDEIDEELANSYDFLYLPCDIKNQCNVGYGFINFINTQSLKKFYHQFHQYRWFKFRSQKICTMTYARLQGLSSLIDHFENSKVLNQKDKKYRPIIKQFGMIENLIKSQQLK